MLIIGLTGGIGSGKTEAANTFSKLGVPVIDTDIIAHELTSSNTPTLKKIINVFGPEFLLDSKQLNRTLIAKTIFNDSEKKLALENILHPAIKDSVEQKISAISDEPYIIIVVPLLFETSFEDLADLTLVVDASEEQQIERTLKRDGRSADEITKIIKHQIPRKSRLKRADDILLNTGTQKELEKAVNALHQRYLASQAK